MGNGSESRSRNRNRPVTNRDTGNLQLAADVQIGHPDP